MTHVLSRFTVEIEMGNAAMLDADDVAGALRILADKIQGLGGLTGIIRDLNGNTVGRYRFEES